jgi:hypothetical protein
MIETGWSKTPKEWRHLEPSMGMLVITMDGMQGERPTLQVSHALLADEMSDKANGQKIDIKTIKRRLRKAIDAGLITVLKESTGRGANIYCVNNHLRRGDKIVYKNTSTRAVTTPGANTPVTPGANTPTTDISGVTNAPRIRSTTRRLINPSPTPSPANVGFSNEEVEEFVEGIFYPFPEVATIKQAVLKNLLLPSFQAGWTISQLIENLNSSFSSSPGTVHSPERLLAKRLDMLNERVKPIQRRQTSKPPWCGNCYSTEHRWVETSENSTQKCGTCYGEKIPRSVAF